MGNVRIWVEQMALMWAGSWSCPTEIFHINFELF